MEENISREMIAVLSGYGRRCIAVLWAYLDESGTHKGSPILSVAGYVGNQKEWHIFEKKWAKHLADKNIEYFHATNPKCDFLRLDLASAITKRDLRGILCAINPDDYNKYATHQFKSTLGNAYAICTFMCALEISQWAQENKTGPVTFVIEAGQPNDEFIERMLKAMMSYPEYDIAGVMLANKKEFIPLQTADFLSHVFSTEGINESAWFEYLVAFGKLSYVIIPLDKIDETSQTIKKMYAQYRKERKSLR